MKKIRNWDDSTIQGEVISLIQSGKLIAGTSDTVVGFLASLAESSFQALNRIKNRQGKPYLVLVRDAKQAALFTDAFDSEPLRTLVNHCWPGPVTLIVPAKKTVPRYMLSSTGAIALRVPNHIGLQAILQHVDGGLFSTSANVAGDPIPETVQDIDQSIIDQVALVVDDRKHVPSKPSTILDCTKSEIRIIRQGAYSREQLRKLMPGLK